MTDLWLLRHGQTDWNLTGRWQGQTSEAPGLNDMGRAQTLAACDQWTDVSFSAIYSSDLLRARQTAELIAESLGLTVTLEPRLREMNLGAWEGMFSDEIEAQYPQELAERARNPFQARGAAGRIPCGSRRTCYCSCKRNRRKISGQISVDRCAWYFTGCHHLPCTGDSAGQCV